MWNERGIFENIHNLYLQPFVIYTNCAKWTESQRIFGRNENFISCISLEEQYRNYNFDL